MKPVPFAYASLFFSPFFGAWTANVISWITPARLNGWVGIWDDYGNMVALVSLTDGQDTGGFVEGGV